MLLLLLLPLPILPRAPCLRVGQGVFMYWIPSSAFQMGQTYAMRNNAVREFIGLQPLATPRGAAGGAAPAAQKAEAIGQNSLTAGVLPEKKTSEVVPE